MGRARSVNVRQIEGVTELRICGSCAVFPVARRLGGATAATPLVSGVTELLIIEKQVIAFR